MIYSFRERCVALFILALLFVSPLRVFALGVPAETEADTTADATVDSPVDVSEPDTDTGAETEVETEVVEDTRVELAPESPDESTITTDAEGEVTVADSTVAVDVCVSVSLDSDHDGLCDRAEGSEEPVSPDTDADGTANYLDTDDDGDGIPTRVEDVVTSEDIVPDADADSVPDYLEPNMTDTDSDGVQNVDDPDDDGDTVPTIEEGSTHEAIADELSDTDQDGTANYLDTDDDGDGIETVVEVEAVAPLETSPDADADTVPDYLESNTTDTDGDGLANVDDLDDDGDSVSTSDEVLPILDADEVVAIDTDQDGTPDLLDPDDDNDHIPTVDEDIDHDGTAIDDDTDGDSVPNYLESDIIDTDDDGAPNNVDADDDGDTVSTAEEESLGGIGADSDADGVHDILDADDDADGIPTAEEALGPAEEGNLLNDSDDDGAPDIVDSDDDNDGTATIVEGADDTDYDGILDEQESVHVDTDSDGISNQEDADDDGDGIPTAEEIVSSGAGGARSYPSQRRTSGFQPRYLNADDDSDGIPTIDEIGDADDDGYADRAESNTADIDGDGLVNADDADDDGDGTPTKTDPTPYDETALNCADVSYATSIVNPDGSVRTMDSFYAKTETIGNDLARIGFDDSGRDMDHNDVVLRVNSRGCRDMIVTVVNVDASWHHQINLTLSAPSVPDKTVVLWENDHENVRKPKRVVLADVLGVNVAGQHGVCQPLITASLGAGSTDTGNVSNLQRFLSEVEGSGIRTDGVFDRATGLAVRAFQEKYAQTVLAPWGLTKGTGYVYTTTTKKINDIVCAAQFE